MAGEPPRLELFLRSLAPATGREQQERVVERAQTLNDEGMIRGFDVVLCGECVCPRSLTADTAVGERLLASYDEFTRWAAETNRDLRGFEQRDTKSLLTGADVTGIVFPRIALAEYHDDTLTFVAPSADGDSETTVMERLSVYESGRTEHNTNTDKRSSPPGEAASSKAER